MRHSASMSWTWSFNVSFGDKDYEYSFIEQTISLGMVREISRYHSLLPEYLLGKDNSLKPSDAKWRHGTWPALIRVMACHQGWGLLRRFPPFRYFPKFSSSPKCMLAIEYHVHIWQVSLQLSCCDTCQIWMRFKESNRYFGQIENFAYGEIDERNFSNPHPRLFGAKSFPEQMLIYYQMDPLEFEPKVWKMNLKISPAKRRPFCSGPNVSTTAPLL